MDDADRAQERIDQDLAADLAAHHARTEVPLGTPWEDEQGRRLCLDCGEVLSPRRLNAMPGAIRCVDCQSAVELYG
ncbi:TraR/DksA C4-type zinc finger protein [uncultured Thiodictyon sp.]|uniref:TraR/DksA C4-type zinc finger protein n=1 Tax=uncultured Thiodictyon sp. TaxID=1846217 RepID=UPI0025EB1A6D|nr:TraR/DksA C4-type zinc finger protein [uncultured Thiodictyon sp.]